MSPVLAGRPPPTSAPSCQFEPARRVLADGATTSVYVASYPAAEVSVRLAVLRQPEPLGAWCAASGISEALVGGFFTLPDGAPLGEVRTGGVPRFCVPFLSPWDALRTCLRIEEGWPAIAPRDELPATPSGDLLQAGPLLVRNGVNVVRLEPDPEGFSAGASQFYSDITAGRYPRAALGVCPGRVLAVACDGRAHHDAGLSLAELAELLVELGALTAINLDGGGSTSLVHGGELRNRPRADFGVPIPGGRPIPTALVFERRR